MNVKISDMYLAAALLSYGADLVEIDKEQSYRQKFCFTDRLDFVYIMDGGEILKVDSPSIESVETFAVAKKLVFLPSYPDSLRSIKSAIHSE